MLYIFDNENKELTAIKETAESFKAKIVESASKVEEDFDFEIWLDECQFTLINNGDIAKETASAFMEWEL